MWPTEGHFRGQKRYSDIKMSTGKQIGEDWGGTFEVRIGKKIRILYTMYESDCPAEANTC